MSIPWEVVKQRLVDTGRLLDGEGRRCRARVCGCGAKVITGLDAELCALAAVVDPTPLSAIGELLAALEGRRTYTLASEVGRLVLNHRDSWRIAGTPAGTGHADVLPEHVCGAGRLPEIPSNLRRFQMPKETACPF